MEGNGFTVSSADPLGYIEYLWSWWTGSDSPSSLDQARTPVLDVEKLATFRGIDVETLTSERDLSRRCWIAERLERIVATWTEAPPFDALIDIATLETLLVTRDLTHARITKIENPELRVAVGDVLQRLIAMGFEPADGPLPTTRP